MLALHDLQSNFRDAMLTGGNAVAETITSNRLGADIRLQIYRNNIYSSLIRALEDLFPAIKALVGEGFFNTACHGFITKHPPHHGRLGAYGTEFPGFLEGDEAAATLPYLPDVARLELAWQQAYHAADATPLTAEVLAGTAPEDMPNLIFTLHPSARLLRSDHPAGRVWAFCQSDDQSQGPDMTGGDQLLIIRPEADVDVRFLAPETFHFLEGLQHGDTLTRAYEATTSRHPNFDLQAALQNFLTTGVFASAQISKHA